MLLSYLLLINQRFTLEKYFNLISFHIGRNIMQVVSLIILMLFVADVSSKENKQIAFTTEFEKLSDVELLKQANDFSATDHKKSIELAYKVLELSEKNNNYTLSAKAHILVANISYQTNDIDLALHHYLQASLTYKKINNTTNQIKYAIYHIDMLLKIKQYKQAIQMVDELLPIALSYGKALPIASTLIVKGDIFYHQQHYNDAIKHYMNSLKYLLNNTKKVKKVLGRSLTQIAQSYKRLKNRKKTAEFYRKALDVYTDLNDKKRIARTLNTLAEAERYLGNLVVALKYSMRGLKINKELDDPVGRNKLLVGAGIIYRNIGRYEKSLEHIYEAHLSYKALDNINGVAKTSNQLGLIYTNLKQFEMAKSFYQLTIDLPEKKIKQDTLALALREMAVIDLNAKNYESAKIMAIKAYNIYSNENDKLKASLTARIIGNIFREEGDNTNAEKYYRASLSLAIAINSKVYQIKAQSALGGTLIENNVENIQEAINLFKDSVKLSIETNNRSQALYIYRKLLKAEKSRNNFLEALHYAEKVISFTAILQEESDNNKLILETASLHSHKIEIELELLKEKALLDKMELAKKNNEIEIAEKTRVINELEIIKNKYASFTLALLLAICLLVVIFIYRRFSDSKKRNRELDYLVARDPLTNCYNRRVLLDLMKRYFDENQIDEYCIIMADIDYFKSVNDTYGHTTGDKVICEVANILQNCIRHNDIVARFGGEEFCIVLRQVSQSHAMRIAENMRLKIEQSKFDNVEVTCSFGITSTLFNAKTPTELINQADLALYKSKSHGRNKVTMWDKELA